MRLMVTSIVVGVLGTVPKGLERRLTGLEIRDQIETIKITEQLKSGNILRKVQVTWGDLFSIRHLWKTKIKCWCEYLARKLIKIQENEETQVITPWERTKIKLRSMKLMVIPLVTGALGIIPKGLVRVQEVEIGG